MTQQSSSSGSDDALPFTPQAGDSVIRKDQMDLIVDQVRQNSQRDDHYIQRVHAIKQSCQQAMDANAGRS